MKRTIIYYGVFFVLTLNGTFAQRDISKEIVVYLTSGIFSEDTSRSVRIDSPRIRAALLEFDIDEKSIQPAFPNSARGEAIKIIDGKPIELPDFSKIFVIKVPPGIDRNDVLTRIRSFKSVLFAEENGTAGLDGEIIQTVPSEEKESGSESNSPINNSPSASQLLEPNDEYYPSQWHLKYTPGGVRSNADIRAPEAWEIFTGSSTTKVAVVELGLYVFHPDLEGKSSPYSQFSISHGTAVASIIAAKANNPYGSIPYFGVVGVDWNAQILNKDFGAPITGNEVASDPEIASVIMAAVDEGAHVLNNSWQVLPSGRYSNTIRFAFAYAYKANRVAVSTMNNYGSSLIIYPGGYEQGIITVGSTNQQNRRHSNSGYGPQIDVVAPGVQIFAASGGSSFNLFTGTSFAAPSVSGIASLLKGYSPNLSNDDIENLIRLSADDINDPNDPLTGLNWDQGTGMGRVNARKAIDFLRTPYQLRQMVSTGGTAVSQVPQYMMTIYGAPNLADGQYLVRRWDVRKNVSYTPTDNNVIWGRGAASTGWSTDSPSYSLGWCEAVQGTVTNTAATLRTYLYEVWDEVEFHGITTYIYKGWYPSTPENAVFAYTVLGSTIPMSATISGPSTVYHADPKGTPANCYTWTANVSGGAPPYSYAWSNYASGTNSNYNSCFSWNGYQGGTYQFTLRVDITDSQNNTTYATKVVTAYNSGGGPIEEMAESELAQIIPEEFTLGNNYPNPFNPETEISFGLPEPSSVRISIVDMLGREIVTLVDKDYAAGYQRITWKGNDSSGRQVGSGVYLCRIVATGQSGKQITKVLKMALTK